MYYDVDRASGAWRRHWRWFGHPITIHGFGNVVSSTEGKLIVALYADGEALILQIGAKRWNVNEPDIELAWEQLSFPQAKLTVLRAGEEIHRLVYRSPLPPRMNLEFGSSAQDGPIAFWRSVKNRPPENRKAPANWVAGVVW